MSLKFKDTGYKSRILKEMLESNSKCTHEVEWLKVTCRNNCIASSKRTLIRVRSRKNFSKNLKYIAANNLSICFALIQQPQLETWRN